jgi:hypothetical protein
MRSLPNRHWRLAVPLMLSVSTAAWLISRPPHNAARQDKYAEPLGVEQAAAAEAPVAGTAAPAAAAAAVGDVVDIFAVRTWEPPPPPPPARGEQSQAPAPPEPPPLPFRFLGRIAEPGQPVVFLLLEGDRIRQVRVGDAIGGSYRVVKFSAGQLYFRYEPMKVTQALAIGNMP